MSSNLKKRNSENNIAPNSVSKKSAKGGKRTSSMAQANSIKSKKDAKV